MSIADGGIASRSGATCLYSILGYNTIWDGAVSIAREAYAYARKSGERNLVFAYAAGGPLETDHADPEFREIKRMFLEGRPVPEGGVSFARCASNNGTRFAPEEAALDADWRFHQEHAALQL